MNSMTVGLVAGNESECMMVISVIGCAVMQLKSMEISYKPHKNLNVTVVPIYGHSQEKDNNLRLHNLSYYPTSENLEISGSKMRTQTSRKKKRSEKFDCKTLITTTYILI